MARFRSVLGLIAGVIILLSSGAHSLLGWRAIGGELAKTTAPPELVTGLKIGWMFGGAVMLVLGILVIATFLKRCRGQSASTFGPALISITYLAFGVWAFIESSYDPFFAIFIVPGALLALAASAK